MSVRNIIMPFVVLMTLSIVTMTVVSASHAGAGDKSQAVNKSDVERLPGRWSRTDASYILELKDISMDGTLKAAYFNPRSINVSRAEWKRKDGKISLFVELRDINYPGSSYSLTYDSGSDRFSGTYYQAVQKQTYAVEFVRSR